MLIIVLHHQHERSHCFLIWCYRNSKSSYNFISFVTNEGKGSISTTQRAR